jgi:hypothetical protein
VFSADVLVKYQSLLRTKLEVTVFCLLLPVIKEEVKAGRVKSSILYAAALSQMGLWQVT